MTIHGFILGCWLVFLGFWIASAGRVKATAVRQSFTQRLHYQIPVWIAALLLWFDGPFGAWNFRPFPATWGLAACGAGVTALGLVGALWARVTLGGNWSSAVTLKQKHELVQHGPYGWTRNPIYTSLLLMFCGTAMAEDRLRGFLAIAVLGIGFWIKLKQEEALLLRQFPEAYPEYKRRVKALVPYLF